ncbi:MAG: PilZ domain-containing protein [Desulfobacterales bacterium]
MTRAKAFINRDNTATIACSVCNRQQVIDLSKYPDINRTVSVKITCKCGNSWNAILEKRRFYRKAVDLPGRYTAWSSAGRPVAEGTMTVVDISRRGLKMSVHSKEKFNIGDWLTVEFHLDNAPRTLIRRMVTVKSVSGKHLGLAFPEHKHEDPDIGFYMLAARSQAEKETDNPEENNENSG